MFTNLFLSVFCYWLLSKRYNCLQYRWNFLNSHLIVLFAWKITSLLEKVFFAIRNFYILSYFKWNRSFRNTHVYDKSLSSPLVYKQSRIRSVETEIVDFSAKRSATVVSNQNGCGAGEGKEEFRGEKQYRLRPDHGIDGGVIICVRDFRPIHRRER